MEENRRLAEEKTQKNQKEDQIRKNLDSIADSLIKQKTKIIKKNSNYYTLEDRHYIIEINTEKYSFYLCFIKGYYIAYYITQAPKSKNYFGFLIVEKTDDLQKIIDDLLKYFDISKKDNSPFFKTDFGMIQLFEVGNKYYPSDASKIHENTIHIKYY